MHRRSLNEYKLLRSSPSTERIRLKPFTIEETWRFMASLNQNQDPKDSIVRAVWEKSGGVPLYIEYLTLYLLEKGILNTADGAEKYIESEGAITDFIRNTVSLDAIRTSNEFTPKSKL